MKLVITGNAIAEAKALPFEVVERKGIGHPDSMADLIAEEFSRRYVSPRTGLSISESFQTIGSIR